jgi:peptidoglycan hydrolase-like protein with peptidoglycan-binding domain
MFGSVVTLPPPAPAVVSPLPRPRPLELALRPSEPSLFEPKAVEIKSAEPKGSDTKVADPKAADVMTNLVVKSTVAPVAAAPPANVMRPPASIPTAQTAGARRVAAVQRALTEYGYGQLKPTGAIGADTQAAILKFERDRKLPVTGQMSDRLVRELTAMIGRPID